MSDPTQIQREIGEIKGLLTGIRDQQTATRSQIEGLTTRFDKQHSELSGSLGKLDDRLRAVEKSGAVAGAITGGVAAVAIALIKGVLGRSV